MALDLRSKYFHPADDAIELRAFTHGLMPRMVPAMMQHFVDDWRERGVDAWNEVPNHWLPDSGETVGWWSLPEYLGDRFVAPLIGAPEGTCIMQPNVHWTVQCILSSEELFSRKKEVVLTEAEFPSLLHSVRRWAPLLGLRPQIVPLAPDGFVDKDTVLGAISPGTALVLLSHVGFTTGEKLDEDFLRRVADAVHRYGGRMAIDGYHAAGSMPVQVQDYDADLYMGGLLKEVSGSSGTAYVYIRPGAEFTPRTTGWFGDADPFAFRKVPSPHTEVRRRFMGGTPAVAPLYHAVEGVRVLLGAGLSSIRSDSLDKTGYCIDRVVAAGLHLRSPREAPRRSAMIIIEIPEADRLSAYLKNRRIFTDSRQKRHLRMAPFVWNSMEELKYAFDVIEDAVSTRTYLIAGEPTSLGPVT